MGTDSSRLRDYLSQQRGRRFEPGVHDCLTFTNTWWRISRGYGFADPIIHEYHHQDWDMTAALEAHTGHSCMLNALDSILERTPQPTRGALVVRRTERHYKTYWALGICTGVKAVFLGGNDVVYLPIAEAQAAWV